MRVLIADDDPVARRLLARLVTAAGHTSEIVADGEGAWQACEAADPPRITLLDWEMPGIDGIEVCRRIRARASRHYVYVLLLTGRGGRANLLDGHAAGADDYITKPFDADTLAARLRVATRIVTLQELLVQAEEALQIKASTDALTGCLNHGAMVERLGAASKLARSKSVGLVSVDLDFFKRINDTWGHGAGDTVLTTVASRIRKVIRPADCLGRMGGEEFLVSLLDVDLALARDVAERIRVAVAAEPVDYLGTAIPVTASVGVDVVHEPRPVAEMLVPVDRALYIAKTTGRNRVVYIGEDLAAS